MDKLGDLIARQKWLKPVEAVLGVVANSVFDKVMPAGQKVRNFLWGTWLGHPLHPAITDIPIGAWTAAAVLDAYEIATGDDSLTRGADVAVGIGLVGAAGAAATGLNDWNSTYEKPRRVGALHAIVNIAATACYAASYIQRRRGDRRGGLIISFSGYALTAIGAFLGGHLVFNERIGVNHAPEELPKKFTPLMPDSKLPGKKMVKAEVAGIPVVVVRVGSRIVVMAEKCSHLGGPLSEGEFDGETITCPWHYSKFRLDGNIVDGPAVYPQPCFEVRVRDGQIEVRRPQGMIANPY